METTPIPEPPGLPILGNINAINPEFPLGSLLNLADTYGDIFRLRLPHKTMVFLTTHALVNEACDEKRFGKRIENALKEIRLGVHDGLFTAHAPQEENWGVAHRVLMPAFGPMSIKNMFPEMHDIATQLAMKWARFGASKPVMVTDDFTRLTLDTLALCAMDFRFNSYYQEQLHPFIEAMGDFLTESGNRARRPAFMSMFYRKADEKYSSDIAVLRNTAEEVLKHRKAHPTDQKDLLNAMLNGVDPKTGRKMTDESIIDNLITFLIAGHETTSGLLSFSFYELLKHPEAYRKAQQEVDEVIGTGPIKAEHLSKLPYISAVLRETLRVCTPIPIIGVGAHKDETLAGKYEVKSSESILLLLAKSQLDPAVFGEDAAEFVPERMLDENFERLNKEFPNCWKPFGNGMRACIGRPFAWQEALLVMAMLLQNFNFVMDDPSYLLQYKQTLTIKPKSFYMRAILRDGLTATELEHRLAGTTPEPKSTSKVPGSGKTSSGASPKGKPISIYYGSNSGTCESMAQRLATDATSHGFYAKTVDSLDMAKENLPRDHPVLIVTASYEGQPPDNAAHFVNWIESLKGKELEGVSYAVFGCGHHDWAQTFHRIPKLVDSTLESLGGSRIAPIGLSDAAQGDMFTDFESWEDDHFWPAISEKYGLTDADEGDVPQAGITVEVSSPRSSALRQDVKEAQVVETRQLSAPGQPVKKHMEIKLPTDLAYTAGDYLAVLPLNPKENILRVMRRFQLPWDANLKITSEGRSSLPTNVPVSAHDIFSAYVELAQPATKRNILALAEAATDEATKTKLKALAGPEQYGDEISSKRISLLDLLEDHPTIDLPLSSFLSMLPPMRVRQYSISSSPLCNQSSLTLTYALLDEPSLSAPGKRRHVGVASNYLSSLEKGDSLYVAVRPSHSAFHLPNDAEKTPIIMIAAGTGIAPFRGFIQERAALVGAGRKLAPAMLFFGCRVPNQDDLYADELARWEAMGAVTVRRAYSRQPESSEGCVHVQDRLWKDREEAVALWDEGAKVYVCGSRGVGESVKSAVVKILVDGGKADEEAAAKWYESMRNVRFATDVFD